MVFKNRYIIIKKEVKCVKASNNQISKRKNIK